MYIEKNTHTVSGEFSKKKKKKKESSHLTTIQVKKQNIPSTPRNPCYSPSLHPTQPPKVGSVQTSNTVH